MSTVPQEPGDLQAAAGNGWGLIVVNRHLHRETLAEMETMLAPGGLLLYHTFIVGCTHPSNPRSLLRSNELFETFGATMDVLRDDEMVAEDGRPMCCFVARRAAS